MEHIDQAPIKPLVQYKYLCQECGDIVTLTETKYLFDVRCRWCG
jgi:DNA-directed RNA polymerase subunit RPC12/RpoP